MSLPIPGLGITVHICKQPSCNCHINGLLEWLDRCPICGCLNPEGETSKEIAELARRRY